MKKPILIALLTLLTTSSSFAVNLLVNPGAEDSLNGWTRTSGNPATILYGTSGGFPTLSNPGPTDRGLSFFDGGNTASASIYQSVDLSFLDWSEETYSYTASGWFGGYDIQEDNAQMYLNFFDSDDQLLGGFTVGPISATDRSNSTGLLFSSVIEAVPFDSSYVDVGLLFSRASGTHNDGYADNLSLEISAVPEPSVTALFIGFGTLVFALVRRRLGKS